MLPSHARLRHSDDIARVRQEGRRWNHPLLVLYVHPRAQQATGSRFAFSVGRHIGKAVRRNRVKRRLRESVRHHLNHLQAGRDCLFVARTASGKVDYKELDEAVLWLLTHSGMIISNDY